MPNILTHGFGRAAFLNPSPQLLFASPAPRGRRITAGFSYIQRIGKSASVDVWFPHPLRQRLEALATRNLSIDTEEFPAEWAAIRQFELLQEGGNVKIYDLDVTHLQRSLLHLMRDERAGGYRVVVASIGGYEDGAATDDLHILDLRLQDRLSKLIHMLYLEEESTRKNGAMQEALRTGTWSIGGALPHIGALFNARDMFRPAVVRQVPNPADIRHHLARQFFDILGLLPTHHILHDTAVGLQLPELIGEHEWIYIAPEDETLAAMNNLLNSLFRGFGKSTAQHLRGTGYRLTPEADAHYRKLAQFGPH